MVFVHGIFSDSRSCWLFEDSTHRVFWPDLVKNDHRFGNVSIYLAGYHTQLDAGDFPLAQCAREIRESLARTEADGTSPVIAAENLIFVCHSTGGIVLRYVLERYLSDLAGKGVGLVLIASPSLGSIWANVATLAARYHNQQLGLQLRWGDALRDLHGRFRDLVNQRSTQMPGLYGVEACETKFIYREWIPRWMRWVVPNRLKVVSTLSAGQYFGEVKYLRNTDHFSTVKPDSIHHPSHEFLVTFYADFRKFLETRRAHDRATAPSTSWREEITICREIRGQIAEINVRLNDLLLAPHGILELVEDYQEKQTDQKWQEIKARAEANHERLEDLYQALEKLKAAAFFGQYPSIENDIKRVIAAKMHDFYQILSMCPETPKLTDRKQIADLVMRARRLEDHNKNIVESQAALSKYVENNEAFLHRILEASRERGQERGDNRAFEHLATLRLRVLGLLGGGSADLRTLVKRLGLVDDRDVMTVIGKLVEDRVIEQDRMQPSGYYRLTERKS
jgi:hypothetical protein